MNKTKNWEQKQKDLKLLTLSLPYRHSENDPQKKKSQIWNN